MQFLVNIKIIDIKNYYLNKFIRKIHVKRNDIF